MSQQNEAVHPSPVKGVVQDAAAAQSLARRLLTGSIVYALAILGTKALSFLLTPLFTRFLTPADYGLVALAQNLGGLFGVLCGLGGGGALRLYFDYMHDESLLRRYISTVLRTAGILTVGAFAIAYLAGPHVIALFGTGFSVPFFPYVALAIAAAAILQPVQYRLLLYQVQSRAWAFAALSTGLMVASSLGMILFVMIIQRGAVGLLVGDLFGTAVTAAAALFLLRKWIFIGWDSRFVNETMRLGIPLVANQFMVLGLEVADRFILQRYRDVAEVGLYSLAYTFGMVMFMVTLAIRQAWSPAFLELASQGEGQRRTIGRTTSGLCTLMVGIAIIGSALAPDVVRAVVDPRYAEAGRVIPLIIGAYLLWGLYGLFSLSALHVKRPGILISINGVALAINLVANFWLVPSAGMYGAAYATLASYGVAAVLMYIYGQRLYRWPQRPLNLVLILAALGAVICASQLGGSYATHHVVLLVTVLCAYTAVLLLGGKELIQAVRVIVKRRSIAS